MNRFKSPSEVVTLYSRSGATLAALPVRRRRAVASDRLLVKLARRIFRPFVVTMSIKRRPAENDEVTRAALMRDERSGDQERFRGGPPRNLDDARYDFLRQLR